MRDDLKKKLTVNRSKLVKGLDVTGLFSELSSNGAITDEHLAIVRAEKTTHEQVDKLIDILLRRPDVTFDLFCDAVKINNPDIFELLTKGPDAQLTNEDLKTKTREVFARIKASIDPKGHVVDTLFQERVITPTQLKEISNGPDQETRAGCLLLHLFQTPHPRAFVVFREALKEDYDWVVEFIDKGQKGDHADIATITSTPIVTPAGSLSSLKALGVGGYGIVYKAQHSEWGTVASKQLHVQLIKDRDLLALKQEAEIQWKLNHPNIVRVLGIVLEIQNYGIVLEFVGKGELLDYIQDNNTDLQFKLSASYDVCLALSYLHSLSPPLIHGDLKIENILLEENGKAKVCDFGFSKWKDYSKSHSKEKIRLGTVTHVPPELWRNPFLRKVESFDVYSYGVCLWEILAGDKPFKESDSELIKLWVLDNRRPNLESIPSETPTQITELMKQCWNDNISSRPRFTEVKKILEEMRR